MQAVDSSQAQNQPQSQTEDTAVPGFQMQKKIMRYNMFVPRLYNWCKSLGFETGRIMPSRAFCSDESQGYPTIMIAKHFGAFPFNHGVVGGIVATDRHAPHAAHGQDLVIIQASHVGYDPETRTFGTYRRAQTSDSVCSSNCGKVHQVITWYMHEHEFAQKNILLHNHFGRKVVIVDNQLLRQDLPEGLILNLDKITDTNSQGQRVPMKVLSTAKMFRPSSVLLSRVDEKAFFEESPQPIGSSLENDMFYFKKHITGAEECEHHLETNLIAHMPQIITSKYPILTAAQINTQIEFDNTYRSIVKEKAYKGKRMLFIAGLNIDISPQPDQLFPLTKFVPWAAYVQNSDNQYNTLEQDELVRTLYQQSTENKEEIDLEDAIRLMSTSKEIDIPS